MSTDEPAPKASLRFGRNDAYDRLTFEWSEPVEADVFRSGSELVLTFGHSAKASLPAEGDFTYLVDRLPQLVFDLRAEDGGRRYRIAVDPDVSFRLHRWNDERLIVLDIFQPTDDGSGSAAAGLASVPDVGPPEVDADPSVSEEGALGDDLTLEDDAETDSDEPGEDEDQKADNEEDVEIASDDDDDEWSDDEEETWSEEDEEVDEDDSDDDEEDEDTGYGFTTVGDLSVDLGLYLQFGIVTAEGDRLSDDGDDRDFDILTDAEVYIDAYTTVLDDVDLGASLTLLADADGGTTNADSAYIYVGNGFGQFQIGRTSGAEDDMALGASTIAVGTGGIDGDAANLGEVELEGSGDAAKISYFTPRTAGFQAGVSYTPDTGDAEEENDRGVDFQNHVGVGLNVVQTFGGAEVGLATVGSFGDSEFSSADDVVGFSVGGTLETERLGFGASWGRSASDFFFDYEFGTLGATLGFGEASTGVGYNIVDSKSEGLIHIVVLSADTPLFEGVSLVGDASLAAPEDDDTNLSTVLAVEFSY